MALSFRGFISSKRNLNTLSKAIIALPQRLFDGIPIKNNFYMVMCICVRGSTLAQFDTVLVWQRAVNRQPGSRSDKS